MARPKKANIATTTSLDNLLNNECLAALDLVDELRTCGLHSLVELPQLVVCGDQSAGKSSVLEALTEVRFPAKDTLCTRFATQVVIRRGDKDTVRAKIIPDEGLAPHEQAKLSKFSKDITDLKDLEGVFEEATKLMGLHELGQEKSKSIRKTAAGSNMAFSRSSLSLEITGPTKRPLTLVDLPGWIHTATVEHTEKDVQMIQDLILTHVQQKKTIVLAIVTANNQLSNQAVLKVCCEAVPDARARSLGIITKMDKIDGGTESELYWKNVALNGNVKLGYGWHVLRNRTHKERSVDLQERNKNERDFFSSSQTFFDLPEDIKGIDALGARLGQVVQKSFASNLPKLLADVNDRYRQKAEELTNLGHLASTPEEQRKLLTANSIAFHHIVKCAYDGTYKDSFFNEDKTASNQVKKAFKFLRAAVDARQEEFTAHMEFWGSKFRIDESLYAAGTHKRGTVEPKLSEPYQAGDEPQTRKTHEQAYQWASSRYLTRKGLDLPGSTPTWLVTMLFYEMSENWEEIAKAHIMAIDKLCLDLVRAVVQHVSSKNLAINILTRVEITLKRRFTDAYRELKKLIQDNNGPLISYDPNFTAALKQAEVRARNEAGQTAQQSDVSVAATNTAASISHTNQPNTPLRQCDNSMHIGKDAVERMLVVYKKKREKFTEDVTDHVIERNLLSGLAEDTFSPQIVAEYTGEMLSELTTESQADADKRLRLEQDKAALAKAKQAFDKYLVNPLKRSYEDMTTGEDVDDDLEQFYAKRAALNVPVGGSRGRHRR